MISLRANNWVFKTIMFSLIVVAFLLLILLKARAFYSLDDNIFVYIYSVMLVVFVLSRIMGAGLYGRTKKSLFNGKVQDENYEPTVTIVIPCKNEEGAIANTIEKCFQAEYPKEKLEVIVINDGSTDNTLAEIQRMQVKYPELIVVNWPVNRGKKEAMAVGFRRAKGELVAQMDSDSYFTPETFRNLVLPFKVSEIAAVCAHADPANADTNWLTRMQAAYYFESFRILKAAESVFMTVFCCSGCSSCYRKSVVMPLLDTWLNEKFLGKPVTWGDDRSLTRSHLKNTF